MAARQFKLSQSIGTGTTSTTKKIVLTDDSIFSEVPVDLTTFVTDKRYLNNPQLSEKQYDLVRHMEQIYLPQTYIDMERDFGEYWKPVRQVNYLIAQWGKGAGKDHAVRIGVARIAYLLLCLKSPQEYYGLAEQDDIHILNIAMNAPQAHRAFFKPLATLLRTAPWFKNKLTTIPTDQSKSIRLIKQLELISGHSEAENFEGLNLIAAVCDEISGFESNEQKAQKGVVESQRSAEAIFSIVESSAATRFPQSFKVVAISYPRYLNDPIQKLTNSAKHDIEDNGLDTSLWYVSGPFATWDVNPRYDQFEKINVAGAPVPIPNVAVYVKAFEGNKAAESRGKFLCLAERSANRYFRNDTAIREAFPKQDENWVEPLRIEYYWGVDTEGAKAEGSGELATVPGWQTTYSIDPSLRPIDGAIYALHADLAISGDRAGIAMCHVKAWERRDHEIDNTTLQVVINPDVQEDNRPTVKVDFVTCYEADMAALNPENDLEVKPREIQPRWFRNLIRELKRRGFVIGLVTFDNFQSTDSIQILESWGILSDKQSMDRNKQPYFTLRDMISDGRIEGYYNELLIAELEGLTDLPNKIDHPPGASKDLADALCGAVLGALTLGGSEEEESEYAIVGSSQEEYFNGEYYAEQNSFDNFWGDVKIDSEIFGSNIFSWGS